MRTFVLAGLAGLLLSGCARRHFFQPDARRPDQPGPAAADSVWATAGRHYAQRSWLHRAIWGRHHRAAWAAPVRVPVLDLARARPEAGPLRATKLGGGFQTASLTLKGPPQGRAYVLRSLDKDPARVLPKLLRPTFLANWTRDATAAGLPYGALVVAPLAQALGLPHARPRLYYVPAAADLGLPEANERLRGKLALLEEKFSGPAFAAPGLPPQTRRFVDTEDLEAALHKSAAPAARLDQPALLRARLLDLLVGDWDRHGGQWQWAEAPDPARPGGTRYAPVPKDRDQVFFRLADGPLPWLLTRRGPGRHLATFRPKFGDLDALTSQSRRLDERGLNELTRRDFAAAAAFAQARLPDSTLARAVRRLPPAVYALEGPGLLAALQARRARLPRVADEFYARLARRPLLAATARPERFVVQRGPDSTVVRIYSPSLGADSLTYQRTFYRGETRRLRLAGLDAADRVVETGRGGPALRRVPLPTLEPRKARPDRKAAEQTARQ